MGHSPLWVRGGLATAHRELVVPEPVFDGSPRARMKAVLEATTEDRVRRGEPLLVGARCAVVSGALVLWGEVYRGGAERQGLAAQAQLLDERAVTVDVGPRQVVEQPATAPDEQQQATARMVVVLVLLE